MYLITTNYISITLFVLNNQIEIDVKFWENALKFSFSNKISYMMDWSFIKITCIIFRVNDYSTESITVAEVYK